MNKKIFGVVLGLTALAASTAASAHVNVGVGIGIPVGVYAPAEPVYAPPPPVVYAPPLSPSHTATMTGGRVNGVSVANGVNVSGVATNGASTNGASVMIGAGIETARKGARSATSNLRVSSNES